MLLRLTPFLLVVALGCDQLTSKTQGVAVLTRTPDLANATDMSPELAAALPLGSLVSNGATAVAFALGERAQITSTTIAPVSNANITVSWSGVTVGLCAQTGVLGTYAASSVGGTTCGDARLAYDAQALYTFDVETAGDQFTIRTYAPLLLDPADVSFDPALSALASTHGVPLRHHDRTTPLKIDWSRANVGEPAIIAVFRLDYVGSGGDDALQASAWRLPSQANPVFENGPKTIDDYVNLIFDDSPATSYTVPRETFSVQGLYLTVVTPVQIGTDVSKNLSLGSGSVAGVGTAFAFWVQ